MYRKATRGFTIVELLIVIVIIGILAAITIVAYNGMQERAKVQRANTDLNSFVKAIRVARLENGKTLMQITGSGCTYCSGHAQYLTSIDKIAAASNINLDFMKSGDPWGNDYVLDENEGEISTQPCRIDTVNVTNASSHSGLVIPTIPFFNC